MPKSILLFVASGILSFATFYFKSEHFYDMHLVVPVGVYFIVAYLLSFQPQVELKNKLIFFGSALVIWLVLFGISYNMLFFITAPVSGALGAWLIIFLSNKYLQISFEKKWTAVTIGLVAALLGLAFMIMVKKGASIGIKAGLMTALWQMGVGIYLAKEYFKAKVRA